MADVETRLLIGGERYPHSEYAGGEPPHGA